MNTPILLFGMPRSGTTWIGKIFDSHPDVLYKHEPDSWIKLKQLPMYINQDEYSKYCEIFNKYLVDVHNINLPQVTTKLPVFNKNYSTIWSKNAYRCSVVVSSLLGKVSKNFSMNTISPVASQEWENVYVAWKSIESLGRLGLILSCNEACKAVHIIRHPCGYIASVLKGEQSGRFQSSVSAADDYGVIRQLLSQKHADIYGLSEEKMMQMTSEQRLAWRWVLTNEKALIELKDNKRYRTLIYEELCESPISVAQALFEFVGLSWNAQTESFLSTSTSKSHDAYYSVYKDPSIAMNKWKTQLAKDQIQAIKGVVEQSELLYGLYKTRFV